MTEHVRIPGGRIQPPKRYHTDETCRKYPDEGRDIPLCTAEERGFVECNYCSGAFEPAAPEDPWKRHRKLGVMDNE